MYKSTITALIFAALAGTAWAHSGATGIVKTRMDGMTTLAGAMKSLNSLLKAETLDREAIILGSEQLQEHSGKNLSDLFPEGSIQPASQASDTIWTDWEGFQDLSDQLDKYAQGLVLSVDAGGTRVSQDVPEQLQGFADLSPQSVFTMIGKTCSACHADYRIKK
jgi:cytochrome c556